jgi:hypothetical protein
MKSMQHRLMRNTVRRCARITVARIAVVHHMTAAMTIIVAGIITKLLEIGKP